MRRLLEALGSNGKLLTDIIPEIEILIGKQPEIPVLDAEEARTQFGECSDLAQEIGDRQNEAFAMVSMIAISELKLDPERVNIYGGACAQGHPIGSTGSRLIVTLAHAMQRLNRKRGIAALCIGGGEATAVALSRE